MYIHDVHHFRPHSAKKSVNSLDGLNYLSPSLNPDRLVHSYWNRINRKNAFKVIATSQAASRSLGVLLLFVMAAQPSAFGWGSNGHIYINQVAAQKIPDSMPQLLRSKSAIAQIAYLGPEPDRWRGASEYALNNAQAPDHFIDLERIEGLGDLPRGRYEFYKLLYAKRATTADHPDDYLPENVGLQPYITMEVFERLRIAFRDYRGLTQRRQDTAAVQASIIFYAGWLGHYVADGSQPLHTTISYDGWVGDNPEEFTTERGIHARFESDFVNRTISAKDFAGMVAAPRELRDPFADYMKYLWDSHGLIRQVYQFDKARAFNTPVAPEAVKFTEQRLAAGAQMLLDLWYTAWQQSAQPEPPKGPAGVPGENPAVVK
jgi:hypothetical protein